jgi:putative proteasome-type protease
MTFCLGMRVADGLVGIADTRVTSGTECITALKVSVYEFDGHAFFLMTSGLRSVRDKALTYFEELLDEAHRSMNRLYKAANVFSDQVRRAAAEDREALENSKLHFDLHTLVGGQFADDKEHKLYLIYPQGNWVEIGPGTPYCIIGESGYGKPILDRTLKFSDPMSYALKVGCLAFDSTRISASNVNFPIDVVAYDRATRGIIQHRYEKDDLLPISNWWQDRLRTSVNDLPSGWMNCVFGGDPSGERTPTIPLVQREVS